MKETTETKTRYLLVAARDIRDDYGYIIRREGSTLRTCKTLEEAEQGVSLRVGHCSWDDFSVQNGYCRIVKRVSTTTHKDEWIKE